MNSITHQGRCHCGNLALLLETALLPEQLPQRICNCDFCRKHGARYTSDAGGTAAIGVADPQLLGRYRFGLHSADFIWCRRCGVYVGAVMEDGAQSWAVFNLNVMSLPQQPAAQPVTFDFGGETFAQRRERRRRSWTPLAKRLPDPAPLPAGTGGH
jgi:hypothetical protein